MSCEKNPAVAIAGIVAGVSIPIVLIVGIFNKDAMWVAAPVIGVLAIMGAALAFIARRKPPGGPGEPKTPPDDTSN